MFIQRCDDLVSTELSGDTILVNLSNGRFFGFGETGACIWKYLEKPRSPEQILSRVTGEFDVRPEVAAADIDAFLEALASETLTMETAPHTEGHSAPLQRTGIRPYTPPRLDRERYARLPSGMAVYLCLVRPYNNCVLSRNYADIRDYILSCTTENLKFVRRFECDGSLGNCSSCEGASVRPSPLFLDSHLRVLRVDS